MGKAYTNTMLQLNVALKHTSKTCNVLSMAWVVMAVNIQGTDPVNSLAPGKFEWNCRHVIFKQILVIDGWGICCEIT